jgi:CHAT domain-containing protein
LAPNILLLVTFSPFWQGTTFNTQGDPAKTKSLIERAQAIYEKAYGPEHNRTAKALSLMGIFYLTIRDYEKAEQSVQRAVTILEKMSGPEHSALEAGLNHLAVINQAKGNEARAIEFLTRSIEMTESHLTLELAIGSERQKRLYLDKFIADINTSISLHVQSAPNDRAAGRLALTTILRRKGRALDAMAESIGALRSRLDPKDRELLDQLTDTRAQLATLALKRSGKAYATQYRVQTKRLEDQVEKLEADVGARSAEYRVQSLPVTLEAIQAAIPRDMVLVEFMSYRPFNPNTLKWKERLDERHYIAYLLGNEGEIKWVDLGKAKPIDAGIATLRNALRDPKRKDVKLLARAVDQRVMQPVRKFLGTTQKVLLSPDGALNLLPFAALVDEKNRYLVERYTFSYLTSGRDLLRLQSRGKSSGAAVIIADPDFGGQASSDEQRGLKISKQVKNDAASFPEIYFSPLPGTAEEAHALGEILKGATVLTRTQATEAAIKKVVAPNILHVATHGFFLEDVVVNPEQTLNRGLVVNQMQSDEDPSVEMENENPLLRSGLGLAGANLKENGEEDGLLTALEAAGLNLWGTRLVVLSACDTGVGEVTNGEGVFGLRRALILAGSESQVMSLWPVSDEATRDLMIDYYKALQTGQGRSGGFRRVQLGMLASRNWRHPYYWASFIQSGEWADMKGVRTIE